MRYVVDDWNAIKFVVICDFGMCFEMGYHNVVECTKYEPAVITSERPVGHQSDTGESAVSGIVVRKHIGEFRRDKAGLALGDGREAMPGPSQTSTSENGE